MKIKENLSSLITENSFKYFDFNEVFNDKIVSQFCKDSITKHINNNDIHFVHYVKFK